MSLPSVPGIGHLHGAEGLLVELDGLRRAGKDQMR